MESTNSKKKKYGSIIFQPERNSPVNTKSADGGGGGGKLPTYDDVRITEEDDIIRIAEEINGAGKHMSIMQNDLDQMEKEMDFERIRGGKGGKDSPLKTSFIIGPPNEQLSLEE